MVEDPDLRAVADPDHAPLHDHLVAGAELQDLRRVADRKGELLRGHQNSLSSSTAPSALMCADARRAAQHW